MVVRSTVSKAVNSSVRATTGSGGGAGGGSPALDIRAHVGTSTSPSSQATQDIAMPFEAEMFLPFSSFATMLGTELQLSYGIGAMTAAAQAAIAVSSAHNLTSSITHRRHSNNRVLTDCYAGVVNHAAVKSAIAVDKVSIEWNPVSAGNIFNHIALGGADLEVSLTQHQMNGTNAPQSFAHGLTGGAPSALFMFGAHNTSAPPNTANDASAFMGCWAGPNQFGLQIYSRNGVTTSNTGRIFTTSRIYSLFASAKSVVRGAAVSSVDTTNVNVTFPVTTFADAAYIWILAIRGAKAQVGTFDCNGSLDPLTINTPGITPKLFLPVFVPQGVDSVGTVLNDLCLAIGASDGTNNVSCGITDQNAVTTTNARRSQSSTTLCEYNTAGTKVFEGAATFSGNSVILDPTTNSSSNFGQGGYLVLGS